MNRTDFSSALKIIKNPAKLALAVMAIPDGGFNLITLEWFMRTSIQPPMFAISIGHSRFSYDCLQKERFFNLCFPSQGMADAVEICGTISGRDQDKFILTKLEWFKGRLAGLPIIKSAVANFECRTITQVQSGDHTIYIGEVKYSWSSPEKKLLLLENLTI
ncbi:MAG: flavin reductase family protein [Candidatus Cloacimonetes bacterium]|nr:flavin reductase family protein [Candidatus Cloacimonadota bacterium]